MLNLTPMTQSPAVVNAVVVVYVTAHVFDRCDDKACHSVVKRHGSR